MCAHTEGRGRQKEISQILGRINEDNIDINHISREANRTAHLLAKFARNVESVMIWGNEFSYCIRYIVVAEMK